MDELVKKADVINCLRIGKDETIEISRRGIKKYILGVCRKIKQLPTVQLEQSENGGRRMTISEKIDELTDIIDALKEKYCENCQSYDCDMCPYLMEEDNG